MNAPFWFGIRASIILPCGLDQSPEAPRDRDNVERLVFVQEVATCRGKTRC